ncbi:MAG: recombinase family protein, partial [Proteobacteria bacterium]
MKRQLRIGAYLRVSTDKQVQVFEGSLDTQKYRMVDFVKSRNRESRGWGDIIDFYIDEGISAQTTKRPQYQRLMADVRSGKVNLILVADISRLSRNVHDFSILLKELEKYNASYMSLKEQFDTTTPAGRLMTNMVVTMAQFEREQTSERVSINCNSRAVRGFVNGGRAPLGFKRDDSRRGVLVVDENEAEQVRTIFRVFMEQGSVGKALPVIESLGIFPKSADSAPE